MGKSLNGKELGKGLSQRKDCEGHILLQFICSGNRHRNAYW